jgi:small conductance mechanosensitive channel
VDVWRQIESQLVEFATRYGLRFAGAMLTLVGGFMASGWAQRRIERVARQSTRLGATLAPVLGRLTRLLVMLAVLIAVLDAVGVQASSLLAIVGALGLAIGLALKDTLSDVASGIVLAVLRPFEAGDTVDIGGVSGVVDSIDVFHTRLTTLEGVPIVLPNARVRGSNIQNFSHADRRRIDIALGVAYGADVGKALQAIRDVLIADDRVLEDPAPSVAASDFADNSLRLLVRFWTRPDDLIEARIDLVQAIKEKLDESGIELPLPTAVTAPRP